MARKAQTSVVERKPSSIRWQSVSVWPVSNENHEPVKTKRRAGKKFKLTARNKVYAAPGAAPAPSTPTSYRYDGATAVGRYFVPGDAVGTDSVHDAGGAKVIDADLELLFWGDFWLTATKPSAGDVIAAVKHLLASPYLSELKQYGFNSLNLRGATVVRDPGPPGPTYSGRDVKDMVWALIDSDVFPEPDDAGGQIIYMTLAPNGTTYDTGDRGAHGRAHDSDLFDSDDAVVAWSNYGSLDFITDVLSHELVESITDPLPDSDTAWVMNRNINGGNEIGDACNNTVDRLDGLVMEAYWSEQDKACVIPWHQYSASVSLFSDTLETTVFSTGVSLEHPGPCKKPADYQWFVKRNRQQATVKVETSGYVDPLTLDWSIEGRKVTGKGTLTLPVEATYPDLSGEPSLTQPATLHYEQVGSMLRLTNDPADGSYSVDVAVTINDSLGASPTTTRTFSETVGFVGQEFSWDDAYYYDLVDCSGKLRGYARQALRQLRDPGLRPPGPGGDPPVGPWIEEHPERYRPVDLPDVRDLAHLAHYLQNARPEIANNIASLLKGYERVAGAQ